ncbi:MAG: hypothetical protein M0P31_15285 [Solirubrobacteraceae bacterium]|nr:hypothetical protein [Solirubrobacteraceae bacterium]
MTTGRILVLLGGLGVLVATTGAFSWPFSVAAGGLLTMGLLAAAMKDDARQEERAAIRELLERLATQPAARPQAQSAALQRLVDDLSRMGRTGGQG